MEVITIKTYVVIKEWFDGYDYRGIEECTAYANLEDVKKMLMRLDPSVTETSRPNEYRYTPPDYDWCDSTYYYKIFETEIKASPKELRKHL